VKISATPKMAATMIQVTHESIAQTSRRRSVASLTRVPTGLDGGRVPAARRQREPLVVHVFGTEQCVQAALRAIRVGGHQ
jgi:hypothetical protein